MSTRQINTMWSIVVVILIAIIGYMAFDRKDNDQVNNEQSNQSNQVTESTNSTTPTSTASPVTSTTEPTVNDPYADIRNWKTYRSEKYGVTFKYPATMKIVKEEVRNENLGSKWFRLELIDESVPEKPWMRFEVDSDGYGPFFPEINYVMSELSGGDLEISSRTLVTSENSDDGVVLITTQSIESRNGHWYNWFFSYGEKGADYEPLFVRILSTYQFIK